MDVCENGGICPTDHSCVDTKIGSKCISVMDVFTPAPGPVASYVPGTAADSVRNVLPSTNVPQSQRELDLYLPRPPPNPAFVRLDGDAPPQRNYLARRQSNNLAGQSHAEFTKSTPGESWRLML